MDIIKEFLSQYPETHNKEIELLIKSFTDDYPEERIKSLTIEEYNHTGYHNTFCYRLEKGLIAYSAMGNVFPNAYGVYIDSKSCIKINAGLTKRSDGDYIKAFSLLKEDILRLLELGDKQDYDEIDKIELDSRVKFKLLSVYHPEKFFPVCAMPAARDYCACFGIEIEKSESMMRMNRKLCSWRDEHLTQEWSLYQTMALSEWMRQHNKMLDSSFRLDDSKELAKKLESEIDELNLVGETREAIVKMRVNQGVFRDRLFSREAHCKLCGVNDPKILVASHIKPWSESAPEEKLDCDNGFLMCPNHDKLFDRGLITFSDDGKIIISGALTDVNRVYLNVDKNMQIHLNDGNRKYLEYHRNSVFQG